MKKILSMILVLFIAAGLFAACGNKLPESFDAQAVTDHALEIADLMGKKDFQEVENRTRSDLKEVLSADVLEQNVGVLIDTLGAVTETGQVALSGAKDSNTAESYAVAVVIVTHEYGKAQYTISFNEDFEIVGLYMK